MACRKGSSLIAVDREMTKRGRREGVTLQEKFPLSPCRGG
ncbi:hypothetical protein COO91_10423 (plasmid) [Nostoc flagelliforme CCNUN1]|uniref:Uncharacterized protein n=1 Tax=Nostoc flagelliforme CCNUN1 TaxID=2038116 RepID=A0A2K8T971_9NOSO|nr:hypothetical protein COO91_10423 [Nostoc flagelliforme CCNUN1]